MTVAAGVSSSVKRSAPGAIYGLSLLAAINLLNYLDRYIVAGVLPSITDEFKIDKGQAGLLGTLFVVVYMLASPVAGFLGDRMPRRYLIAAGVGLWSIATAGSGLATTFGVLLFARAVIGIGEAGYGTVAPALISDFFPKERRTQVLSIFYIAIPVGAAAGYGIGGYFAGAEGYSWRTAFFVGGIPGLALAILAAVMKEPARGAMDDEGPPPKVALKDGLVALRKNALFWFNNVGQTLMTFSIGGLAYWMPSFFRDERGMTEGTAGLASGAITAIAGLTGTVAGGFLGDWADRRRVNGGMWVSGLGLTLAAPVMFLAAHLRLPNVMFALVFIAQFLIFLNSGPLNAAIVNCVSPAFRAFAMGINVLIIHTLGDAISPPIIGLIADASTLEMAIKVNALPLLLGGLVLIFGVTSLARRPGAPAPS